MLIMSRTLIVQEKLDRLIAGYSAYAETDEIIRLMKREITKLDFQVVCEHTENGCWFVPEY
ncbi:hypothetical protein [Aquibacillus rhizosphaerae]|uniref:Uncharacterized protein n=1 Tax=Aquibacillus rhizosphaerae TaxID=3051431 RepID=A0ABT7L476_9BACI|nr:hypothetical protein [Aquibacillus sp. LR5S19]MDL4840672.1 hypothetical protein [Aquibacillus sp. LR5S19]